MPKPKFLPDLTPAQRKRKLKEHRKQYKEIRPLRSEDKEGTKHLAWVKQHEYDAASRFCNQMPDAVLARYIKNLEKKLSASREIYTDSHGRVHSGFSSLEIPIQVDSGFLLWLAKMILKLRKEIGVKKNG